MFILIDERTFILIDERMFIFVARIGRGLMRPLTACGAYISSAMMQ